MAELNNNPQPQRSFVFAIFAMLVVLIALPIVSHVFAEGSYVLGCIGFLTLALVCAIVIIDLAKGT